MTVAIVAPTGVSIISSIVAQAKAVATDAASHASAALASKTAAEAAAATIVADAAGNVSYGPQALGGFAGPGKGTASLNTVFGKQAGGTIQTGATRNSVFGYAASRANATGDDNAVFGYAASLVQPGGNFNTVVGAYARDTVTSATDFVTAIGGYALRKATANELVGVGYGVGSNLTAGVRFTGVGSGAGTGFTTENEITLLGWGAGSAVGQVFGKVNQTIIGSNSYGTQDNQVTLGNDLVSEVRLFGKPFARKFANYDVVLGEDAGNRLSAGGGRVIIGYQCGLASSGALDTLSVMIGYKAVSNSGGAPNRAYVAIGALAGENNQNTIDCTIVGDQAARWLGRHQPASFVVVDDENHIKAAGADVTQGLPLPANIVGATFMGKNAGRYNTIGQNNTGFGDSALGFTTTGGQNVAVGYVCGEGNVIGSRNAWVGQGIRVYQYSGDDNAQMGYGIGTGVGTFGTWVSGGHRNSNLGSFSLYKFQGNDTTSVGYAALYSMAAGAGGDVAVGAESGLLVTTGGNNTFLGRRAGYVGGQAVNVQNSVALGYEAITTKNNQMVLGSGAGGSAISETVLRGELMLEGKRHTKFWPTNYNYFMADAGPAAQPAGTSNIGIGHDALKNISASDAAGTMNTAVGFQALMSNTNGADHTAFGAGALQSQNGGVGCTAIGRLALANSTSGTNNTGLGDTAGEHITTGNGNTAAGYSSLFRNTTGSFNCTYGVFAAGKATAGASTFSRTCAFGAESLQLNVAGDDNCTVGYRGMHILTGGQNVGMGTENLRQATAANGNVALGHYSAWRITTGTQNVHIGYQAGQNAAQKADATGSIAIGAGAYTTRDNEVVIGKSTDTHVTLAGVEFTKAQLQALKALVS